MAYLSPGSLHSLWYSFHMFVPFPVAFTEHLCLAWPGLQLFSALHYFLLLRDTLSTILWVFGLLPWMFVCSFVHSHPLSLSLFPLSPSPSLFLSLSPVMCHFIPPVYHHAFASSLSFYLDARLQPLLLSSSRFIFECRFPDMYRVPERNSDT